MKLPEGNKTSILADDLDQLVFDIATQLCDNDIQRVVDALQYVLLGRDNSWRLGESRGVSGISRYFP